MKTTFDIDDINIIIKSYNPDIITIDKYSSGLRRLLLFLVLKISIIFLNNHIESSNTVYCNSRIDPTLYIVYTMNS